MILILSAMKNEQIELDNAINVVTGIGLVNASIAATKAILENDIDLVINVGTAGSANLEIGSAHKVSSVINADYDLTKFKLAKYTTLSKDGKKEGEIVISESGVSLASSSAFQTNVINGVSLYDMEGYAIAAVCKQLGKKLIMVKGVSDTIGKNLNLKDYKDQLKGLKESIKNEVVLALSQMVV